MLQQIKRPPFQTIPLEAGLKLRGGGNWLCQEKMDGEFALREWRGAVLVGEQMRGGNFIAFDVVSIQGDDCRNSPLRDRLCALICMSSQFDAGMSLVNSGNGGEFLEAVLARGGEGIVIKDLDAPYGADWIKCKRVETWDLIVVEKATGKSSIRLANAQGEDFGWCPCRAAYDTLNIGDIVEIAAYGRHSSGKLREPRFVGVRGDKMKGNL